MVQLHRHLRVAVGRGGRAEVGHGHAGGQGAGQFHGHRRASHRHHGRVNEVGDGTGVVHGRVVEPLCILIGLAEISEQAHHEISQVGAETCDFRLHGGGRQGLVGEIQAHHGHRPFFIEHNVSSFGVDLDIEFRHR